MSYNLWHIMSGSSLCHVLLVLYYYYYYHRHGY